MASSVNFALMTPLGLRFVNAPACEPLHPNAAALLRTSQSEFPIVDHAQQPVGILSRADLIRALKEFGPETRVKDATLSPFPTCDRRCTLEDALKLLQEKGAPAVGVLDGAGRLVGLVSSETLGEMLMIAGAMPPGYRLGSGPAPRQPERVRFI